MLSDPTDASQLGDSVSLCRSQKRLTIIYEINAGLQVAVSLKKYILNWHIYSITVKNYNDSLHLLLQLPYGLEKMSEGKINSKSKNLRCG